MIKSGTTTTLPAPQGGKIRIRLLTTCLLGCAILPILGYFGLFVLNAASVIPVQRPAGFSVKYEEYVPHLLGPVETKQWIEVSEQRCMLGGGIIVGDMPLQECTATNVELDQLYHIIRDAKFDSITNYRISSACDNDPTALITVKVNDTTYIKAQPNTCTMALLADDARWHTVAEVLRDFIQQKHRR
jgi:hypothetical protein